MKYLAALQTKSSTFKYRTDLGGYMFNIKVQWNSRTQFWHLYVTDSLGGSVDGVKVVEKWPLLTPHRAQIRMAGDIVALPLVTDPTIRLGYDNLGAEWVLAYLTEAELDAWKVQNGVG